MSPCCPLTATTATTTAADLRAVGAHQLATVALVCELCRWRHQRAAPAASQRHAAWLLLLRLLAAGADTSLRQLLAAVRAAGLHEQLVPGWTARLRQLHEAGLEGLAQLVAAAELLIVEQGSCGAPVACSSVVGFFLRSVILAYTRLDFHQIAAVFDAFCEYFRASGLHKRRSGRSTIDGGLTAAAGENSVEMQDENELSLSAQQQDDATASDADVTTDVTTDVSSAVISDACSLVCDQMQRLLLDRADAGLHDDDHAAAAGLHLLSARRIRQLCDSALTSGECAASAAHRLLTLNCVRAAEWSRAVHSLYCSHDLNDNEARRASTSATSSALTAAGDAGGASLSLAALHAAFGQRAAAVAALREALTMARDSGESRQLCAVNSWLGCQLPDGRLRRVLLRRCAAQALADTDADSGQSTDTAAAAAVAAINYARLLSESGAAAAAVHCLLATCGSQLVSETHCGDAAACLAVLLGRLGRPALSLVCCQLVLCRGGHAVSGGGVVAAACVVTRQLASDGRHAPAAALLRWAAAQPASTTGRRMCDVTLWRTTCERHLAAGRWQLALKAAQRLAAGDIGEAQLCEAGVKLLRGQLAAAENVVRRQLQLFSARTAAAGDGWERRVRQLALLADILTAGGQAAGALEQLLAALVLCKRRRLWTAGWAVLLRLAHVLLQLRLRRQACGVLRRIRRTIDTHGSRQQRARLHFLLALTAVRHEQTMRPSECGKKTAVALRHLATASQLLRSVEGWVLLRRVLALQARLYHEQGAWPQRNEIAAEYRQLVSQHGTGTTTLTAPHLQRVL